MKLQRLLSLIGCLIICGCSDNSGGSNTQEGSNNSECSQNDDCDSGKCLDSGKCAKLVKKGDSCDEEHICKGKLKCKDGICSSTTDQEPMPEGSCSGDDDCDGDLICVQGKCIEAERLHAGDDCVSGDKSAVCPENLGCYLGKCMTEEEYEKADNKCSSDDDCTEENHKTCLAIGLCGTIHSIGEDCEGNQDVCEEGLDCAYGTCSKVEAEGDKCSKND